MKSFWFCFFSLLCHLGFAQNVLFTKKSISIPFKPISHLLLINIEINGFKDLNFVLDTGTNGIIVFNKNLFTPLQWQEAEFVELRGIGSNEVIKAKNVKGNLVKIKNSIYSNNYNVYAIDEISYSLNEKFGIDIDGIIGNNFFREFCLSINYSQKSIKISQSLPKLKKYDKITTAFEKGKPFLKFTDYYGNNYNLLMDTGADDSFWFFEQKDSLKNKKYLEDYLGFGLSGEVTGRRIKLDSLYFSNFTFKNVFVAYPDLEYIDYVKNLNKNRDGSVGGEFLNRFNWVIDYKKKDIYYRKNKNFSMPFTYNIVGMEVFQPLESLKFFIVKTVLLNSNAYNAGIRPDDVIVSIEGLKKEDLTLEIIKDLFRNPQQKRIIIKLSRNNYPYTTQISLEPKL